MPGLLDPTVLLEGFFVRTEHVLDCSLTVVELVFQAEVGIHQPSQFFVELFVQHIWSITVRFQKSFEVSELGLHSLCSWNELSRVPI